MAYDGLSQFSTVASSSSGGSSSVSGGEISQQFIAHFYKTLAQDVSSLFSLYDDDSTVIRVDSDEEKNADKPAWYTTKPKKGQVEIHEVSIALPVSKVHIKSVDVCESGADILLLVEGSLLFQHKTERSFSHAFVLAPLAGHTGYYIKNEILRFHSQHQHQHQHQQHHTAHVPQPHSHTSVHAQHVQAASEISSAHSQTNAVNHHAVHEHAHAHAHAHGHGLAHEFTPAHSHAHAQPAIVEQPEAVEHSVQKGEESGEHLVADGVSHSVTSSPSKSPAKAGKDKSSRRKRHEASVLDHAAEQKQAEEQAEEQANPKIEEVINIVQAEPVPAVLANDAAVIAPLVVDSAPVSAIIEEKAATPIVSQAPVGIAVASPAVAAAVPKEEKKPRSWAHVVNKNAPAVSGAAQSAQSAPAPVAAAPFVKPTAAVSSLPSTSSSAPTRPAREFPGTVLVSGVPATAKNDDVKEFFSSFGTVTNTRAVTLAGKTSVYITFASNSSANAAVNQSNINFLGVPLQVTRSNATAAAESDSDDGFQQTQNRRHARAQERKQEKQTPAFVRGGRAGRGRGGRGANRGGRGGAQTQTNGTQSAPAAPAATSG